MATRRREATGRHPLPARPARHLSAVYPPHVLREYALLADGERGAMVGARGDVSWLCAPCWDSEPVFESLVGGAGRYAVTPGGPFVWGGCYDDATLIWTSTWTTTAGVVESREALSFPGTADTAVLLRRITAVDGPAELDVLLTPVDGFAGNSPTDVDRGVIDGVAVWTARLGDRYLRWSGAAGARERVGGGWEDILRLKAGATADLVLEISVRPFAGPPADPGVQWPATERAWARSGVSMSGTVAPRDAGHAHAVLRGLTRTSGGMVAAATTSLPERAQAGRNYDYRYVWIRDQCCAGQAAAAVGSDELLDAAISFVGERLREDGERLVPAYTCGGGAVPNQRRLRHPPGYPGAEIVVGNQVNEQFQLDAFGNALLLFAAAAGRDRVDLPGWQAVEAAAAAIDSRWREPDAGIWELDNHRWTHSRLTCVAGLRGIAGHAPAAQAARWTTLADAILADTSATCLHPAGHWQRAADDSRVDAALLLPPVRGAMAIDDPRTIATRHAVLDELSEDGYLYRFRHDDRELAESEGAFLLCGFMAALDAHRSGDPVAAARWFERNRASCGPPGLFTEEYDVRQRQLRGNIPQAFVHALMLETSAVLAT